MELEEGFELEVEAEQDFPLQKKILHKPRGNQPSELEHITLHQPNVDLHAGEEPTPLEDEGSDDSADFTVDAITGEKIYVPSEIYEELLQHLCNKKAS